MAKLSFEQYQKNVNQKLAETRAASSEPSFVNPSGGATVREGSKDYFDVLRELQRADARKKKDRKWFEMGAFDDGYDFGDVSKTILGSLTDVGENAAAGLGGMGEKTIDALAWIAPAANAAFEAQNSGLNYTFDIEKYKKQQSDSAAFIKEDLYDEEKIAKAIISAPMRDFVGIDAEKDSVFGEKSDAVIQSGGQLAGQVALQAMGVPWWVTSGITSFGSEAENALNQGATMGEAGASAAINAAAEILTEKLSGGIKFGGKTADDAMVNWIAMNVSNKALRTAAKLGLDMAGEGSEEVVSGILGAIGQKLTYADENELNELFSSEDAWEAFIGGAALGGIGGGVQAIRAEKNGADYASGLTNNEKAVVDSEYQRRLKEAEERGEKVKKSRVYDDVIREMDRGEISTDTIEEVLGGQAYRSYRKAMDSQEDNKLLDEYEQLGKKAGATPEENARYMEMTDRVKGIRENRAKLKTLVGDEVSSFVKNDRLSESYNQRALKGQTFKADLSQYSDRQKAVYQKAMESKVLNNTRRSHEFVDLVAKISADKGIDFDFTNNTKLKESGFAIEGVQVNGYVNESGITINMDAAKAVQSVVGHEITHVLEGTELYGELQKAVFDYARARGELASRWKGVKALYQGKNNIEINKELAADLVGDYIFADSEFVNNLYSGNRNIFEKIYDEVKYLCKVVTAGSKEARQLEKVKKMFADAYRMETKTETGTRYSMSSISNTFFGNADMTTDEFLQSDYKQTEGYKQYVDQCLNNMRQTRPNFNEASARKEIEESIEGIIQVAIAAKQAGYDIYDDNSRRDVKDSKNRLLFSSLEPNSDYFTSSDISTICDKRKNFAEIYDEIVMTEEALDVPKGKRFFDNVDNYFALHKIMADKGLTQPCRQCYVESMRKNLAPMANAFLRLVGETNPDNLQNDQLYHQKGKQKGQQKVNNASLRESVLALLDEYGMSANDLNVEMLTTAEGLAQLKIQAPMIYEAFNSFYGQSKPKMPKKATPFRFGELTALLTDHNGKVNQRLINLINHTGGFRLQSYSDFQIQNYTDVLQVIYEAGTLGLNGHAYTKVPAFLDATKGTNLKRNISIFMYKDGDEWKLDRNDSFPYTLDEIYDIVRADRSGNTSIIAVSQNNDMSAWIMANDMVGYGIPFHKSGLKMGVVRDTDVKTGDGRIVKGYSGTKDHTRQQTEVWAKAGDKHKALTKVSKGIDIYEFWDFENAENLSKNELIEKNLKRYIDECEKAGYLPKFRDYVMNNGKILSSVLEHSKKLGYADQTIDDISFEYKGYRIPYGYYKFLGDFGMFTPDGKAAPQRQLSLRNYDFDQAVKFFSDSETLRRNEILQQFANGEERQKYRDSNLTAEQLADIVKQRRREVAQGIVARNNQKYSLSDIAPVRSDVNEGLRYEPAIPVNDAAPVEEKAVGKADEPENLSPKDRVKKYYFDEVMSLDKMPEEFRAKHGEKWTRLQRATENAQDLVVHGAQGIRPLNDIFEDASRDGLLGAFENYMHHLLNMDRMSLEQRFGKKNKAVFGDVTSEMSRQEVLKIEKEHPHFKELAQDVYAYTNFLKDILLKSGKISQETSDLWAKQYPHYVPVKRVGFSNDFEVTELLRFMIENLETVPDTDSMDGFFHQVEETAPLKSATGSDREIYPLFDTLSERAMQTYWAAALSGSEAVAPVRADVRTEPEVKPEAPAEIREEESSDPKILDVDNEIMRKGKMNPIKWVQEYILDNGMVFERLAKKVKDRGLEADWSFTRNSWGAAQHLIGKGDQARGVRALKDIFADAKKTGAAKEFNEYLCHKRNLDDMTLRVRFGVPSNHTMMGRTAADSIEAIYKMDQAHPEFKALSEDMYAYSRNLRNLMVEQGLITEKDAQMWEEMSPHWIPINTVEGEVQPVFKTMAQETLQLYHGMAMNKFGVHLKNTLGTVIGEERMDIGSFIQGLDKHSRVIELGGNIRYHTVSVYENGKKITFEITDEMYEALKPTSELLSASAPGLSHASTLRRNLITAYSPWFTMKNFVRDVQEIVINSQHPLQTYGSIIPAIREIRDKGEMYQEYVRNGGEQNTYFDMEKADFSNGAKDVLETVTGLKYIQKANNFVEMVPRFAEYIASRESGESMEVAMLNAARVTTNFAAGGKVTKLLNRNGATFLNASVQGFLQQARNFAEAKENGFKGWASLAARFAVSGLPVALLNALIWDDDEEYQELPDYITDNYYIIAKFGESGFVRLPKGRTAAVIQSAVKQVSNMENADWNSFFQIVAENLAPNNPLEDNIFAPIVQVAKNETWYGENLVPNRLKDLPVTEQYDEKTSSLSIWLSNKLEDSAIGDDVDLSPKQIHYLLDQYSGVLGDTILPFLTPKAESPNDSLLGKAIAPVRDIFTTDSVLNNRVTEEFYDVLETVEAKGGSKRSRDRLISQYMITTNVEVSELLQEQRIIQTSDLPDSMKYELTREIKEEINNLMERAMAAYDGGNMKVKISGLYAEVGDRRYNYSTDKDRWYEISAENDPYDYYKKEQEVTKGLGISYAEYWNNRKEYNAKYYYGK